MVSGTMVVGSRGRGMWLGQSGEEVLKNSAKAAQSVPDIDSGIHLLSALEFMSNLRAKSGSAVGTLRAVVKSMGETPAEFTKQERESVFNTLAILENIYNGVASFLGSPMEVEGAGTIRWDMVSSALISYLNSQGVSIYTERWTGPALQFEEVPFPSTTPEKASRFISNGARTSLFEDFDEIVKNEKALKTEAGKVKVALEGWPIVVLNILKTVGVWLGKFVVGKGFIRAVATKGLARALFSGQGALMIGGVATTFALPFLLKAAFETLRKVETIPGIPGDIFDSLRELLAGIKAAAFPVGAVVIVGGSLIALTGGYMLIKSWTA